MDLNSRRAIAGDSRVVRWVRRVYGSVAPVALAGFFLAVVALAVVFARDPASVVVACAALGLSLFNLWRAELRGPLITALLVDHPTVRVAGNALAVRFQVSQPLVIENVGGHPCVLAGVELVNPMWGGGNWWGAGVKLKDAVVPCVLRRREPLIARLTFDLSAYGTSPRGERYDLAEAMEALRGASPGTTQLDLVYTDGGRTRRQRMTAPVNGAALEDGFKAAQERARYGDESEPKLTMPGDEDLNVPPGTSVVARKGPLG